MPALLSPRAAAASVPGPAAEDDAKTLKKKKSVMGRLKSKISNTLNGSKKKSFVGGDTSPTDSDLKNKPSQPEVSHEKEDDVTGQQQQHEDEEEDRHREAKAVVAIDDAAEIEPFDAKHVDDEYDDDSDDDDNDNDMHEEKPPAPAAATEQEEVFASDYKSLDGHKPHETIDDQPYEDDYEEEKLEVFGEVHSGAEEFGNQVSSRESLQESSQPELGLTPTGLGGGMMDLVVVGLSPLKTMRGPPLGVQASSPVKQAPLAASPLPVAAKPAQPAQPQHPEEEHHHQEEEENRSPLAHKTKKPRGGIKVEFPQDNDGEEEAINNGLLMSERPAKMKKAPQFSSGVAKRSSKSESHSAPMVAESSPPEQHEQQPLLSDFRFGSDLGANANAGATDSPAKRRGAAVTLSPPMRKSLSRDHEQQVMGHDANSSSLMPPSPKTRKMTPGASRSSSFKQQSNEHTLEGIKEEEKKLPSSPRKMVREPLSKRRASSLMEAPILASAFVGSADPESHDDQTANSSSASAQEDEIEEEVHESAASSSSAFAFDAGAAITQEFGERVARLLGADPWGDRQDGFDAIVYLVKKADLATAKNKRELFCAALAAVQCGVEDRVAPVMYCALECLRTILKEFSQVADRTFVKYQPMNEQLSSLVKSLTLKLGDSNKRTQRETSQALIRIAKQKKLKGLPHVLLHLSAKEVSPRLQMETLRQLVKDLGVDSKSGLSLEVVMQFALPALKIADEKTRKAAVELIADLHMVNGSAVNAQLVGTKPEMLRVINRRVDELIAKREKEQQTAQNANQAEEAGSGVMGEEDLDKALELVPVPSEDAKKVVAMIEFQLQQAAGVVGPVAWRKLESKTWSDRKEALVDIEKVMTEAKSDLRDAKPAFGSVIQQNFLAYCITVHKCLGDSIAPVVNSAMDCLSTLIKVFGPCVEWREESVRDVVLLTIMRLFSTMQKPNSRTNRAACRSILKLARLTNAHTLRYTLSCIFAKETDALVQMHLLRLLIPEFGFQQDGISAAMVLSVVGTALVHSNEKVRKTAIDVALCTQRLVGKEYVLKKLQDVKPVTLKELEKSFVDCEMKKDGDRPQTVNGSGDSGLPLVNFGGGEQSRRLLNSAPVGVGKLQCTPQGDDDEFSNGSGFRRASVLSNDEENLMDSILDAGDF